MNKGNIREKALVENLFKNQEKFKTIEDLIIQIGNQYDIDFTGKELKVVPLTSHDNKKYNHTWDCVVYGGVDKLGISIKTNNNRATKHPQHVALIKKVFSHDKSQLDYWLKEFYEVENKAKNYLLSINPQARVLKDVRKDAGNKTIKNVDKSLAEIYQKFFFRIFSSKISSQGTMSLLKYFFSELGYIKVTWNDKDKFIVEDYMQLDKIFDRQISNVEYIEKNNNIRISFGEDLILEMRFKISFYKKYLVGGAIKSEINIKKKPEFIKKYIC